MKRLKINVAKTAYLFILAVSFTYGVLVGRFKWQPYGIFQELKSILFIPNNYKSNNELQRSQRGEDQLMEIVFPDTISDNHLYYPPIKQPKDILEYNERVFINQESFDHAYDSITILNSETLYRPREEPQVLKVSFIYQSKQYEVFAYATKLKQKNSPETASTAALIIPGSGINQSLGIALTDQRNYHYGIQEALHGSVEYMYTLIKPNEDFLAWHNGKGKKLGGNCIWNWHLNRNGSYSISYIVQSLAFVKWMKKHYKHTVVAGLSQGGTATLINAIQSQPSIAVVSSGISLIMNDVEIAGHDQIIGIPGYSDYFKADSLIAKLSKTSNTTRWLFTWGKLETDVYLMDAQNNITASKLNSLENILAVTHDGAHIFPVDVIVAFLKNHPK